MNLIAHALVSYAIGARFGGGWPYIVVALFFGLLPDIDHLPHIGRAIRTGRFGCESRSFLHELPGLSLMAIIAVALSPLMPLGLMYYPLIAHYIMDFLTRPTRPLYPFSNTEVHLGIYPKSRRGLVVADVLVTAGIVLWLIL